MAYQRLTVNLTGAQLRKATLKGRSYTVAPAVILKEGILKGSAGAVFYPDEQNQKSARAWNHKPIVVDHPMKDDKYVGADDPVVMETRAIGMLLNTKNRKKKLTTEAWIDDEYANSIDARILTALNGGKQVEVSTGLDYDAGPAGEFEGEEYGVSALNYRPDHLAVLPDQTGALSIKAGGGLLQVVNFAFLPERTWEVLTRSLGSAMNGAGLLSDPTANELSFSDISCQLSDLLSSKYGDPGQYWRGWIEAAYEDYVIFHDKDKTWKINYSTDGDSVSLVGDAVEVKRVVDYQTANQVVEDPEDEMPKKFDKVAHVASLIGNGFVEADRPKLEAMDDDLLQKILPKKEEKGDTTTTNEVKKDPPPKKKEPQKFFTLNEAGEYVEVQARVDLKEGKEITFNELLEKADPDVRYKIQKDAKAAKARKAEIIDKLVANGNVPFTKEFLEAKGLEELEGMAQMVANTRTEDDDEDRRPRTQMFRGDFRGMAGGFTANDDGVPKEKLPLPKNEYESIFADKKN